MQPKHFTFHVFSQMQKQKYEIKTRKINRRKI